MIIIRSIWIFSIIKNAESANITVLYDTDKNRIQVAEHGSHKEKKPCCYTRQNTDIVFKENVQYMSETPETCHFSFRGNPSSSTVCWAQTGDKTL